MLFRSPVEQCFAVGQNASEGSTGAQAGSTQASGSQAGQAGQSAQSGQAGANATSQQAQPQQAQGQASDDQMPVTGINATTIPDLNAYGMSFDDTQVTFSGEAVGTIIDADASHKWVSLAEGGSSIAVYVTNEQASRIQHLGAYGETGDQVSVTGTFSLDCGAHQGDVDVHAISLDVIASGGARVEELNTNTFTIGVVLLIAGIAAGVVYWRMRERAR